MALRHGESGGLIIRLPPGRLHNALTSATMHPHFLLYNALQRQLRNSYSGMATPHGYKQRASLPVSLPGTAQRALGG